MEEEELQRVGMSVKNILNWLGINQSKMIFKINKTKITYQLIIIKNNLYKMLMD